MLGGSFWVSFLRNGLGAGLMIAVFMLLEHPAAFRRKMAVSCILFWLLATTGYSCWYLTRRVLEACIDVLGFTAPERM